MVSVLLLGVLLGTPAAGLACALECTVPTDVASQVPGASMAVGDHAEEAGCHVASSTALPTGAAVGGDIQNCRDHPLPDDGEAAVLTAMRSAAPAPAAVVSPMVPPPHVGVALLRQDSRRGPPASATAVSLTPLVLRI